MRFSFPLEKKKLRLLDHPDVALVACIMLATQILYPFDGEERYPFTDATPSAVKVDWEYWRRAFAEGPADKLARHEVDSITAEEAWVISEQKVDDYLEWYQHIRAKDREGESVRMHACRTVTTWRLCSRASRR